MVWYEEIGFDENPFITNPLERGDPMIGRDKHREELFYRIESGSMALVVGPEGSGKTMLLKQAIDRFKGRGKVIYIDGSRVGKRLNIETLLLRGNGLIKGSLLKIRPKGMILLMDNVSNLSLKNNKRLKFYFDQGYLKSIVFTTSDYASISFSDSIKDRIGRRIIKLREVSEEDAVSIAFSRLEGNNIISKETIKEIWAVSGKSLKSLLLNCAKVCEYAISEGDDTVRRIHVKKALTAKGGEGEKEKAEACHECGSALEHIGDSWLCPECDSYCRNCGSYIREHDIRCPSCGIAFEGDEEAETR